MTGQKNHRGDRYDRARSHDEPGAHSGAESQAQERSVPGTASAREGYQPGHGTTAGNPLEGVEAAERARHEPDGEGKADPRQEAPWGLETQPSNDELLNFDTTALEDWDEKRARAVLNGGNGPLYRNHLHIAMHLDQWAKAESERTDTDARYRAGYVQALEDMAAYLRQTYYLPEGG
ncbi:hypothetical protein WJ438_09030 [Streptomyces sp. GD-15H]|uniref:hypothetical protein n=1 Tax=Streptomyces sp. GD-15H TaxID=3129112 RepID=UPI00324818C8